MQLGAFDGFKRLFSTVSIQRQPHERGFPLHFRPPADGRQVGPVLTMIAGALAGKLLSFLSPFVSSVKAPYLALWLPCLAAYREEKHSNAVHMRDQAAALCLMCGHP